MSRKNFEFHLRVEGNMVGSNLEVKNSGFVAAYHFDVGKFEQADQLRD